MTNNKLTDETLSAWKAEAKISLGETAKDTPEYSHHAAIFELVTELQECRKTAEPIYQVQYGNNWHDVERGQYDDHAAHGSPVRVVYAVPPAPVIPATLPCAVELKPGFIIGKGCKTETLLTALQRRADYYAEIDAMTPEERTERDASIEAFKAMLPKPVQPDIEMLASALINAPLAPSDSQGRPRAQVVPDEILNRLEHEANHVTAWHHMDEHSCKVNRRDLLALVNACRAAMLSKDKNNG